jgi:hypothetical protein
MAKLLTIGCSYTPGSKVGVDANGQPILSPKVIFYFNCDSNTANIVAGSGVAKDLKASGDKLIRFVNADDYKKFIYGKNAFPKILSALEQIGGYVYDTNNLPQLEKQVEQAIDDVVNSELSKKLYVDRGAYIDDILKALEQNFNDPKFMQYLNSIGSIRRLDPGDYEKIISFSALNNAMILTQWLKSGHQGVPRFLATAAQWQIFNREPIQGAKPIYAVRPSETQKGGKRAAMNAAGVDQQTYDTNAMSRLVVKKFMNDINYGQANNNNGGFNVDGPYYDLSETQLIKGMQDNYDFYAIANNKEITNINAAAKKEDDTSRFDMFKKDDADSNKYDPKTLLKNISDFASKTGDAKLARLSSAGDLGGCIDYLAENSVTISRLRGKGYNGWNDAVKASKEKRSIYYDLIRALIYMRFGFNVDKVQSIIATNMSLLRKKNGPGYNQNAFNSVLTDFQNIYFIMIGLKEDLSDDLFIWGLNALGLSVEEYKNMPKDEEEAAAEIGNVREAFIRNFNMLLR